MRKLAEGTSIICESLALIFAYIAALCFLICLSLFFITVLFPLETLFWVIKASAFGFGVSLFLTFAFPSIAVVLCGEEYF